MRTAPPKKRFTDVSATLRKKTRPASVLRRQNSARVTIPYTDDLLLSLKESRAEFETEARLLLAVKLYEQNRVSTGMAARLAGISRVQFMFALGRYNLSPFGVDAAQIVQDMKNA